MELILKETISTLGQEGDIVIVKAGYGRNYLLPQGKAVTATAKAKAELEANLAEIQAKLEKETAAAQQVAKKIEALNITFEQLAGDDGRLFGSITNGDIANFLAENGVVLDKRQIVLTDPIKAVSESTVLIKVGYQVSIEVTVKVVPVSA